MSMIIAIDIGGTQIRVATFSGDSTTPIKVKRTSTQGENDSPFDRLVGTIREVLPQEKVDAIYAAIPGPVDPNQGIIFSTPNIPGWVNFPFVHLLKEEFSIPTFIDNDANLAAVGEWRYGAAQAHKDVVYLTISTGIGGGVICDGHMLTGARGMAAELGHITILPNGPRCGCGQYGHLEALASGTAIARYVRERIDEGRACLLTRDIVSAREVARAAGEGDALCIEAFTQAGRWLGMGVANFLQIFNPSILVFGGGVSRSGSLLFEPMKEAMSEQVMDKAYLQDLEITTAQLGDDAGLMGALAQARMKLGITST